MKIEAVMFDVIGTTVKEKDPNTIIDCLVKSFSDNDVAADIEFLNRNRGRDKMEVIKEVVAYKNLPQEKGSLIFESFKKNFLDSIDNFVAAPGAGELFDYLKQNNVKIGLGTGLPPVLFDILIAHLEWDKNNFDYIGIASPPLRARPYPDMILDMMRELKITTPENLLKVGDTIADVLEGRNAGVCTVAILSGTQDEEDLEKEKPDFMIRNLAELKMIIN